MRNATVTRTTGETDISVQMNIDGTGKYQLESGVPFFDHMLTMIAKHGLMDLAITCKGDTEVDDHHTIEDLGITMGQALKEALGDKAGITRYATQFLPMVGS
ncbi:MAG: imidazoleglycerol-phosphate dehydratase, partial [Christensenellaceae bacterium]|nr:imidazoleglycerol-phosphate dehydratase [Christensenellaceae bacterium]